MLRALVTLACMATWFRAKTSTRAALKLNDQWNGAVKALGLKPGPKDSIEAHVKHAMQSEKVDALGNVASNAARKALRRSATHFRTKNFGARWFWSLQSYLEVAALGVAGAWLWKHDPDTLGAIFNGLYQSFGVAWQVMDAMGSMLTNASTDEWQFWGLTGVTGAAVCGVVWAAVRSVDGPKAPRTPVVG